MCFKRRAILVACDPNNKLHGITEDLHNWYCSLQHPYLGGWDCYEMIILPFEEATVTRIKEEIKFADDNDDYLLFVFSGHGGINISSNQTLIQLQDGLMSENELYDINSRCQRKTIYFDCCRNLISIPPVIRRKAARFTDKDVAKFMYLWLLSISSPGIVRIYSAQKGEVAQDSPSFTQYLFQSVNQMIDLIKDDNYLCYSTYDIIKYTNKVLPIRWIQHPQYSPMNGGQQFPFIVNPYIQIEDLIKIHF